MLRKVETPGAGRGKSWRWERGKREGERLEKEEPWPSLESEKQSLHWRMTFVKMLMMDLRGSSDRGICPAGPAQRGVK